MAAPLLEVRDLRTWIHTRRGVIREIRGRRIGMILQDPLNSAAARARWRV